MNISLKFFVASILLHFGIVAVVVVAGQSHGPSKIRPIFVELLVDFDKLPIETNSKEKSTTLENILLESPSPRLRISNDSEAVVDIKNNKPIVSAVKKNLVVNYPPSIKGVNLSNISYIDISKRKILKETKKLAQEMIVFPLPAKPTPVVKKLSRKKSDILEPSPELGAVVKKYRAKNSSYGSFIYHESEQDIEGLNKIKRMTIKEKELLPEINLASKGSFAKINVGNKNPTYPIVARIHNIEGTVLLKIDIDHLGSASKISVRKTSGYQVLDKAAYDAVKKWVFIPAQRYGKNVSGSLLVPIRFSLSDDIQN